MAELPTAPTPTPTKDQVAEAAVQALMDKQAADSERALRESLDIKDPGQRRAPEPTPAPQAAAPPATIPGASADGITDALLDQAAEIGLNENQARALGADGVRSVIARFPREPEPEPDPGYKFDPYTGKPLKEEPADDLPDLGKPETKLIDPETGAEIPADDFDPALRRVLEAQKTALKETRAKLQQIEAQRQQNLQDAQKRRDQRDYAILEKCFTDDAEMKGVYGEGPAHRLVGTAAHENRMRTSFMIDAIMNASLAKTIPDAYEMAKAALHSRQVADHTRRLAQQQIYDQARDAQGRYLARPTATERTDDLPKGPARALRTLERMLREQGAAVAQ